MMRLRVSAMFTSLCALGLLLAACAPAVPATPPPTPAPLTATPGPTALPSIMDCIVVSALPTTGPTEASIFPSPTADDHILGPDSAAVTFLEYTDFQAPASAALDAVLAKLAASYPQKVRRVFRPFPLPSNDKSVLAAAAVEAAGQQDQFWQMGQLLMEKQGEWIAQTPAAFSDWLVLRAKDLGLDAARFSSALTDAQIRAKVAKDQQFGLANAIPIMPFLLVNGRIYQGPRDLRSLESLVGLTSMEANQLTDCPSFVIDPQKTYYADIETSKGKIVVQLFPKEAPNAVNNFVFLARKGWYDGVIFHRVVKDQIAQSGDPSGSGYGSPGYAFADEIANLQFDKPGVLAMANAGPNSNGSQFFFTYRALPDLDGKFTIFGSVLEGMDTLNALTARDPSQPVELPEGDKILKIGIREQ